MIERYLQMRFRGCTIWEDDPDTTSGTGQSTDFFTYTASDGQASSSEATVEITVEQATTDSDGDGVVDSKDACPEKSGNFCNGCPKPTCSGCKTPTCPETGQPTCEPDDSQCTATNASGVCSSDGTCSYDCHTSYSNCDSDWTNGCEVASSTCPTN